MLLLLFLIRPCLVPSSGVTSIADDLIYPCIPVPILLCYIFLFHLYFSMLFSDIPIWKRPSKKLGHARGCQSISNGNIPEKELLEDIKLVWSYREKRRRESLNNKNNGRGNTKEEKKGAA